MATTGPGGQAPGFDTIFFRRVPASEAMWNDPETPFSANVSAQ
jgi:hypothetical protein